MTLSTPVLEPLTCITRNRETRFPLRYDLRLPLGLGRLVEDWTFARPDFFKVRESDLNPSRSQFIRCAIVCYDRWLREKYGDPLKN